MTLVRSAEYREKQRQAHLGKKQSIETIAKRLETRKRNDKPFPEWSDERRQRSSERQLAARRPEIVGQRYASYEYFTWSETVRRRDNFTCQNCGSTSGKIVAHHVQSWEDAPDLRFDESNGVTLCTSCHRRIHPH